MKILFCGTFKPLNCVLLVGITNSKIMDDAQSNRIEEDDDDDDDDDDEIIIIENPTPKLKPPLIVLCESDDEQQERKESKDFISLDDSLVSPDIIDIVSEPEDMDNNESSVDNSIWSNNTSRSSCIQTASSNTNPFPDYIPLELPNSCSTSNNVAENELDKKMRLIQNWYEKFKTKNSGLSSLKPSYTCPECRAELSTIKMLNRHVQSRHPSSIHRYQDDYTNAKLWNKSHSNETASQQRLKLNPLKSPISSGRITCGSMNISNKSTCMLTKNHQEPSKIVALPSLVDRRTPVHQDDKVTTATNTTSGRSTATDSINNICQPLTVVIYSPNSERRGNDRFVRISPLSTDDRQNDTDEKRLGNANGYKNNVIELFDSPCRDSAAVITVEEATRRNESRSFCTAGPPPYKRRRQDPLLLLTEDDNNEQVMTRRHTKNNQQEVKAKETTMKKTFSCNMHGKTFATQEALLQHNQAKHQDYSCASKVEKGKNNYSLRTRSDLNLRPFPSSSSPPSMDKLKTMKHIIMIDIDNWQKIFESDLTFSPSTFVWGFQGGSTCWKPPASSSLLNNLRRMNCFYLHPKCGRSKDAADFALCVQAGKLDVLLPKNIIFTVLSGDRGFNELQNQLSLSKREVHIVNPHHKTIDTVLTILNSIADR